MNLTLQERELLYVATLNAIVFIGNVNCYLQQREQLFSTSEHVSHSLRQRELVSLVYSNVIQFLAYAAT